MDQPTVGRPTQFFSCNSLSVYNSLSAAIHLHMIRPIVKDSSSTILEEKCIPFDIEFCKELPYNYTIYPNGFGHQNEFEAQTFLEPIK